MIRITTTFLSKEDDPDRVSLEYKIDNPGSTESENAGALAMLGLVISFFDAPNMGEFLTAEQGEIVRKKINEIVSRFGT